MPSGQNSAKCVRNDAQASIIFEPNEKKTYRVNPDITLQSLADRDEQIITN
jgi:hypothetical protein